MMRQHELMAQVFREDIVAQALRLDIRPRRNETLGAWRDRTRLAALRNATHEIWPAS